MLRSRQRKYAGAVVAWLLVMGSSVSAHEIEDIQVLLTRAESGDAPAQYAVGLAFAAGRGVPQDYERARHWYQRAAAQGYAAAENNLGVLLMRGLGGAHDDKEAVEMFRRAAQRFNVPAQNNLAWMYEQGRGVTRDLESAYVWLLIARSSSWGGPEYRQRDDRLGLVEELMLREQINNATDVAHECLRTSLSKCD